MKAKFDAIIQPEQAKYLDQLLTQGADPIGGSPQELASFLRAEIDRWTKLIRQANIRAD